LDALAFAFEAINTMGIQKALKNHYPDTSERRSVQTRGGKGFLRPFPGITNPQVCTTGLQIPRST